MARTKLTDRTTNDKTTLSAAFTDASGTAVDPNSVTLVVKAPDGTQTTYTSGAAELSNPSTGTWTKVIEWTSSGQWYGYWKGTGTDKSGLQAWKVKVEDALP